MSKIKFLGIAVVLLVVTNIAVLCFVWTAGKRRPPHNLPGHEGPKQIIIERLHFDDAQIPQYDDLIQDHRRAIRALEAEVRRSKNELYMSLSGEGTAARDSLLNKLGQLQTRIEDVNYRHFSEIKALCKPEQIGSFNALTKELATFFSPSENFSAPPKD
jgi:protein CpxP